MMKNTFTVLKFSDFKTFVKASSGFELMTYRLVINALANFATLLDKNFGKENNDIIMLDVIVCFDQKYVTIWSCVVPS